MRNVFRYLIRHLLGFFVHKGKEKLILKVPTALSRDATVQHHGQLRTRRGLKRALNKTKN